jgi:hypothetical protein
MERQSKQAYNHWKKLSSSHELSFHGHPVAFKRSEIETRNINGFDILKAITMKRTVFYNAVYFRKADVSEEHIASNFDVEEEVKQKTSRNRRYIPPKRRTLSELEHATSLKILTSD